MDGLPWRDIVVLLHTSMYKVCRVSWQINVFPCLPSSNGAPCTEGLEWTVFVVLPEQQPRRGSNTTLHRLAVRIDESWKHPIQGRPGTDPASDVLKAVAVISRPPASTSMATFSDSHRHREGTSNSRGLGCQFRHQSEGLASGQEAESVVRRKSSGDLTCLHRRSSQSTAGSQGRALRGATVNREGGPSASPFVQLRAGRL